MARHRTTVLASVGMGARSQQDVPRGTRVKSTRFDDLYGRIVGWDPDLEMLPLIRWERTDIGREACEPHEYEIVNPTKLQKVEAFNQEIQDLQAEDRALRHRSHPKPESALAMLERLDHNAADLDFDDEQER